MQKNPFVGRQGRRKVMFPSVADIFETKEDDVEDVEPGFLDLDMSIESLECLWHAELNHSTAEECEDWDALAGDTQPAPLEDEDLRIEREDQLLGELFFSENHEDEENMSPQRPRIQLYDPVTDKCISPTMVEKRTQQQHSVGASSHGNGGIGEESDFSSMGHISFASTPSRPFMVDITPYQPQSQQHSQHSLSSFHQHHQHHHSILSFGISPSPLKHPLYSPITVRTPNHALLGAVEFHPTPCSVQKDTQQGTHTCVQHAQLNANEGDRKETNNTKETGNPSITEEEEHYTTPPHPTRRRLSRRQLQFTDT